MNDRSVQVFLWVGIVIAFVTGLGVCCALAETSEDPYYRVLNYANDMVENNKRACLCTMTLVQDSEVYSETDDEVQYSVEYVIERVDSRLLHLQVTYHKETKALSGTFIDLTHPPAIHLQVR